MSETPGQVLMRLWDEMDWGGPGSESAEAYWDRVAAAFLAEMRCVRFVPPDAAEVELAFDPDDYPVR